MSSLLKNMTTPPRRARVTDVAIPSTFGEFCAWLGIGLSPGQAELVRVAFDGLAPHDVELAHRLFGDLEGMSPNARRVVAAVCGARAGKSYILVALRLVYGMLVRDLSGLAPNQQAFALIIAPNTKLRREVLNYAIGAVRSKPELRAMLVGDPVTDGFTLLRPDGHEVVFEIGVATTASPRGRWLTDFALDESAFFRDNTFKINDEEIFRAGAARVLPGGQTIVASTPWAEAGLLHELYVKNFGKPDTALVAYAPTLTLHDSPDLRLHIENERKRDPDNARREFDAVFMTSGGITFFEAAAIEGALTDDAFALRPRDEVVAGADFGFTSDSSALILAAFRDGIVHIFDGSEQRPDGEPLKPSQTVGVFAKLIAGRCGFVMADQHYREAIAENLEAHDLAFCPAPTKPVDTYVKARMMLRDGRVRIHPLPFRDRLVKQMREVQGRPTSGGAMSIVHPQWSKGGHGDICAALVLALWQIAGDVVADLAPVPGTQEYNEAQQDKRRQAALAEQKRLGTWQARLGYR